MQWLENFTLVMRSSITTLRDKIEDPERMLHQLIVDMEEELEAVREGVAEAIADEIQLGKRVQRAREDSDQWLERATTALKRNDEEASKQALDQKVFADERADTLQEEYQKQQQQTAKLQASLHDLEDKIRQARQKRTLLLARMTRANSTRRINQAMDRAENRSAFAQFSRLEDRVERSEAMCEAYDRLEGRDPETEELKQQFNERERREKVRNEFEELKQRIAD
jgi:phage shock protein A